jgi:hypothetical protein
MTTRDSTSRTPTAAIQPLLRTVYLTVDSALSREIYSVEFQHKKLYLDRRRQA